MALPINALKCSWFLSPMIRRSYHSSRSLRKWPTMILPDNRKLKHQKKIQIWKGMTLWDLGKTLRKDMDFVNNVLKPEFEPYMDNKSGEIKDLDKIITFLNNNDLRYSIHTQAEKNLLEKLKESSEKLSIKIEKKKSGKEVIRPPIVTIMGHVDHGKTTLLDALRNSNVVEGEFGGITQHIGAFSVNVQQGKTITFIDTPGHAAFSSLRNRGAEVTDIVVLIVAADDGVMEQTVEAIKMARNAGANIIVAVNKVDKSEHNMNEIKKQLLQEGIQTEDAGGSVQLVPISALKRINLDALIESILVEAEMMVLKGDPDASFEGVILESSAKPKGKVATVLVKNGTLRKRTVIVAGEAQVRVKQMLNADGQEVSEATLSQPVEVIGWKSLPIAGDKVFEVSSLKKAISFSRMKRRSAMIEKQMENYVVLQEQAVQEKAINTDFKSRELAFRQARDIEGLKSLYAKKPVIITATENKLSIIVKGDVNGSVEAILDVLDTYDDDDLKLDLVYFGVGELTKSDLEMAKLFNAIVYCFNLSYPQHLKDFITANRITVKLFNVIYRMIEDLKSEINLRLPTYPENNIIGTGEVLQHFDYNQGKKKVPIAGSLCLTGEFHKSLIYQFIRDEKIIYEGEIQGLKLFKTSVNTVKKENECGIMVSQYDGKFEKGDKIVCLEKKMIQKYTSWNPGF